MLDISLASRDQILDGFAPKRGESAHLAPALPVPVWQPRLILAPPWRLDAKARLFKRLVDLGVALIGLLLIAPVALCLMLVIRLESRGPVLFRQQRVGLHGEMFTLLKFRTMHWRPANALPLRQCTRHDPRVTRTGRWLRRHSLDELPQLINVLRGDMSIVGPRPHAPGTRAGGRLFEDVTHRYEARHCVKPGITGLAQVRGWRGETDTEEKLLHRVDCDLEYIATWSPGLDLSIICRTAGSVLRMRNAW